MREILWFVPQSDREWYSNFKWTQYGMNYRITFPEYQESPDSWLKEQWYNWFKKSCDERLIIINGKQSHEDDFLKTAHAVNSHIFDATGGSCPDNTRFFAFWETDPQPSSPPFPWGKFKNTFSCYTETRVFILGSHDSRGNILVDGIRREMFFALAEYLGFAGSSSLPVFEESDKKYRASSFGIKVVVFPVEYYQKYNELRNYESWLRAPDRVKSDANKSKDLREYIAKVDGAFKPLSDENKLDEIQQYLESTDSKVRPINEYFDEWKNKTDLEPNKLFEKGDKEYSLFTAQHRELKVKAINREGAKRLKGVNDFIKSKVANLFPDECERSKIKADLLEFIREGVDIAHKKVIEQIEILRTEYIKPQLDSNYGASEAIDKAKDDLKSSYATLEDWRKNRLRLPFLILAAVLMSFASFITVQQYNGNNTSGIFYFIGTAIASLLPPNLSTSTLITLPGLVIRPIDVVLFLIILGIYSSMVFIIWKKNCKELKKLEDAVKNNGKAYKDTLEKIYDNVFTAASVSWDLRCWYDLEKFYDKIKTRLATVEKFRTEEKDSIKRRYIENLNCTQDISGRFKPSTSGGYKIDKESPIYDILPWKIEDFNAEDLHNLIWREFANKMLVGDFIDSTAIKHIFEEEWSNGNAVKMPENITESFKEMHKKWKKEDDNISITPWIGYKKILENHQLIYFPEDLSNGNSYNCLFRLTVMPIRGPKK